MKINFDISKIKFDLHCEKYDFLLGKIDGTDGNDIYPGIDVPCKADKVWRFWLLFENEDGSSHTEKWDLSDKEKEYIQKKAKEYLTANGYTYYNRHFVYRRL